MADWILKGRYLMGDVIGSGGMAMVYKATRLDTGETVAIKMLRAEYREDASYVRQFQKEAQICIEHHHRNIVDTLEVGEEDGRLFIVMEYVQGQTLKEYIQKHPAMSHERIVDIGVEICDALYYAHCNQLVHRDIKPQNIMLTSNHTAKVADFGIARSAALSTITMGGEKVMGSVHYFSPEQARGGYTDCKTDLYSLGIVLYEMATGQLPFQGDTAVSVAIKQLQEKPVPPSQLNPKIPSSLEDIILKAIEKDPQCRYESARELANDLTKSLRYPEGNFVRRIEVPPVEEGETVRIPKIRSKDYADHTVTNTGAIPRIKARRHGLSAGSIVLISFLALLLVVLAVGAAYLVTRMQESEEEIRYVPNVVGMTSNEAQLIFDKEQIIVDMQEEYSDLQEAGHVVRCEPGVDAQIDTSTTVTVYVSKGSEKVPIPELEEHTLEEAKTILTAAGLEIGDVRRTDSPGKPDDLVLQQDPLPDTLVAKGSKVDIWIVKNDQRSGLMTDYVGQEEQNVLVALEARGLRPAQITRVESEEAVGTVLQQEPAANEPLPADGGVKLWISKGMAETVATPILETKTYEIVVTVTEEESRVSVQRLAGEEAVTLVDELCQQGEHHYTIPLDEEYPDAQTVIIWVDEEEVERVVVAP